MERVIKFKYWNTISNIMVNNPTMPYKEGWTIERLFSDRGWIWLQYTGLKDKNGKEIYEGDIIYWKHLGKESAVEVYFNEKEFVFVGKPIDKTDKTESWLDKKCTYLGNIHENPELFNKKQ